MSIDNKTHLLRREVLHALSECQAYALPEDVLYAQINAILDIPITPGEVALTLRDLQRHAYVDFESPPLGGPRRWRITDAGRKALLQQDPP